MKQSLRLDRATPGSAAAALADAVGKLLGAGVPGSPKIARADLDTVVGASFRLVSELSPEGHAAYTAALIWARLHLGMYAEAVELADHGALVSFRRAAVSASPATQSACYSVLAELKLLSGQLREGSSHARIALEYALDAECEPSRYRALGLLAGCLALNGEISTARETIETALEVGAANSWEISPRLWPLALADMVASARLFEAERLQKIVQKVTANPARGVVERTVARLGKAWMETLRQDYSSVVATLESIVRGTDATRCPPFLIDLALGMESLALVQLGDPGAAVAVTVGRVSPPEHSVCFELLRATAYLQLGETRKALRATEACVRDLPGHSLGTLPSVLLRRAMAYELLGQTEAADAEFSRASHLVYEFRAVTPALGLALDRLAQLVTRLQQNEPEFGAALAELMPAVPSYPDPAPLGFVPAQLTEREAVLAKRLRSDLTLSEIAAELHVSINTVKSQTRSLYGKLAVSSRSEAVARLDRAGLY